jgi:hypothetical protein
MSASPDAAPDLVRPIIGFRQWRLQDGVLRSIWTDDIWDGGLLRARCRADAFARRTAVGEAPDPACTCGVYAWHGQVPIGASATRELVAGAVALWGAIEIHATGMRAQYGRIVALSLPLMRSRKRLELAITAGELGIDLVPHRQLAAAAMAYGTPIPATLRPGPKSRALTPPGHVRGWGSWLTSVGIARAGDRSATRGGGGEPGSGGAAAYEP